MRRSAALLLGAEAQFGVGTGALGLSQEEGQALTTLSELPFSHLFIRNEPTNFGVRTRDQHVGSLRPVQSKLLTHLVGDTDPSLPLALPPTGSGL